MIVTNKTGILQLILLTSTVPVALILLWQACRMRKSEKLCSLTIPDASKLWTLNSKPLYHVYIYIYLYLFIYIYRKTLMNSWTSRKRIRGQDENGFVDKVRVETISWTRRKRIRGQGIPFRVPFRVPFRISLQVSFRAPFKVSFRVSFRVSSRILFRVPFKVPFGALFRIPCNIAFRVPFRVLFRIPFRDPFKVRSGFR